MATGSSARQPLARQDVAPPRVEGVDPRGIIRLVRGYRGELSSPFTAGPLAGLLIAKWAGYVEAEHEAVAAFEDRAFEPELPDALRRPAWEGPIQADADAVVDHGALVDHEAGTAGVAVDVVTAPRRESIPPIIGERSRPILQCDQTAARREDFDPARFRGSPVSGPWCARCDRLLRPVRAGIDRECIRSPAEAWVRLPNYPWWRCSTRRRHASALGVRASAHDSAVYAD